MIGALVVSRVNDKVVLNFMGVEASTRFISFSVRLPKILKLFTSFLNSVNFLYSILLLLIMQVTLQKKVQLPIVQSNKIRMGVEGMNYC